MLGRPSAYDTSFCEKVYDLGKSGKSVAYMAGTIGVHKDTLYEWAKVYPDFSDAFDAGRLASQMWWEDAGQSGMRETGFGGNVWSRSMAARFPADWREVKGTELSGPNGAPIPIEEVRRLVIDPNA